MSWGLWGGLFLAIPAATVFACTFYLFWAVRFARWKVLGVIAEYAFLVMIVGLGVAGISLLLEHVPR